MPGRVPLRKLLAAGAADGRDLAMEDVLGLALPLLAQVAAAHERGLVAPVAGLDCVWEDGGRLVMEDSAFRSPVRRDAEVARVSPRPLPALHVVRDAAKVADADGGGREVQDLALHLPGEPVVRPVYLPGFGCWELALGHHDALADVFVLGLVLGSLALSLDLGEAADLAAFVEHRGNLFRLKPRLNPVLAKAVVSATELDRHRRTQDLGELARTLRGYRDQIVDLDVELSRHEGFRTADRRGQRQVVLGKLKERLFEMTRRNRLLHFRPTLQTVNLTLASVPLLFDPRHIRPEQLFTFRHEVERLLSEGKPLTLTRYLRFDDAAYLGSLLDRILADARRDTAELGFSQLRLALCFLRWHDLKEAPEERIESPLLLLPVELGRKRGVRDAYVLTPLTTEAEVNPVLRHALLGTYGIALPEALDLAEGRVESLHEHLAKAIAATEPGVTLRLVDRPHVAMIHEKARRRLDQYRRRLRLPARSASGLPPFDWSYSRDDYRPLGIQWFRSHIRPSPASLGDLLSRTPRRPLHWMAGEEPEKRFVEIGVEEGNRYVWDLDLCSVTLGNFRSRRMSLVRDYEALQDGEAGGAALGAVLSTAPRPAEARPVPDVPTADRFPVVPCDPTQASAIARARTGESYIIQGPPGTGKSQTITNLIADYVARGKRVLFVCEKRAAIDVVYHRLRQVGLHEVACLVHDSQQDKKALVMDLKETYERLLREAGEPPRGGDRADAAAAVDAEAGALATLDEAMQATVERSGTSLWDLVRRALALGGSPAHGAAAALSPEARESLPGYREVLAGRASLDAIRTLLDGMGGRPFVEHRLAHLAPRLSREERPLARARELVLRGRDLAARAAALLPSSGLEAAAAAPFPDLERLVEAGMGAGFLHDAGLLGLLGADAEAAEDLRRHRDRIASAEAVLRDAASRTARWRTKLSAEDTDAALAQALELGGKTLPFLSPSYWRLRGLLRRCYDFGAHAVAPTWVSVLEALRDEHAASQNLARERAAAASRYRTGPEADALAAFAARVEAARGDLARVEHGAALVARLADPAAGASAWDGVTSLRHVLAELAVTLDGLLARRSTADLASVSALLGDVDDALPVLPEVLPVLAALDGVHPSLAAALRELPLTVGDLERAILARDVDEARRADPRTRAGERERSRHRSRLARSVAHFQDASARAVSEVVRRRFLDHVALGARPGKDLDPERRAFRKEYKAGRKLLEHEFGKTMRYRAIREILQGEAREVALDLKPVWLMSPLSVADTLPLSERLFHVVVFDEASQVTLEEAVPALARAEQVIVVGDEMQLPPTSFFSASRAEGEASMLEGEDGGELAYALDSDSLLDHAARQLPSTLLGWHYRSRSESLISFSNAAFYGGRLLTVPDRGIVSRDLPEIRVAAPDEGGARVADLLRRPVSFHRLPRGGYENRRNASEAAYVAHLLRGLLAADGGPSIAVVAFSEAQQDEIEGALERLAASDAAFRERLEREREREDDGQFCGLLVKNLENVQGDERDVVILSVCYGHGRDGRMLMSFGPINQAGGERRLNVVFSRAKRHMAVVSSIGPEDVTNTYNDGAAALQGYLRYAQALSAGDAGAAEHVLGTLLGRPAARRDEGMDAVVADLRDALERRGHVVAVGIGQSRFRVPLAVRRAEDDGHRLAVLVDTEEHYASTDVVERDVLRPQVLSAFGWRTAHVLTREWYEERDAVLERLEGLLRDGAGEA